MVKPSRWPELYVRGVAGRHCDHDCVALVQRPGGHNLPSAPVGDPSGVHLQHQPHAYCSLWIQRHWRTRNLGHSMWVGELHHEPIACLDVHLTHDTYRAATLQVQFHVFYDDRKVLASDCIQEKISRAIRSRDKKGAPCYPLLPP